MFRARRGGPRTPSITTDANLDRTFVENTLVFVALKIGRAPAPLHGTSTLGFQIDHTVGKIITRLENDIDIDSRATEMCPNIKAIDIWQSALDNS